MAIASESQVSLDKLERQAFEVFDPDECKGQVCKLVFEKLRRHGDHFESLDLHAVISALNWQDTGDRKRAVARALDFLAFGSAPVLERMFEFLPLSGESKLKQHAIEISEEAIRHALETQLLVVGETGEETGDFIDRVNVSYRVAQSLPNSSPSA